MGTVGLTNDKNEKQNIKIKSGFSDQAQYYCKLNSVAFSPQANYTDRAAAACRRS
jgi:hypothetical protein